MLVPLNEITRREIASKEAEAAKHQTERGVGVLVSPPGEPMPNARLFLKHDYGHAERCLLIHQGGQFYRWDGTCWPSVEDPILRSELYRWFEDKKCASGDKLVPFAPTSRKVAD